jgi:hypothetical protein
MAAGLKIDAANIESFRQRFCANASQILNPSSSSPNSNSTPLPSYRTSRPPLCPTFSASARSAWATASRCWSPAAWSSPPHPAASARPGDHLQLYVRQGNNSMKCIAFGYGAMFDQLRAGTVLDVAFRADAQRVQRVCQRGADGEGFAVASMNQVMRIRALLGAWAVRSQGK